MENDTTNLIPIFKNPDTTDGNPEYLVDQRILPDIELTHQNINSFLLESRVNKTFSAEDKVFKLCKKTNNLIHINEFSIRNSNNIIRWDGTLEEKGHARRARRRKLLEKNTKILRTMMHGDESKELHCLKSGLCLENKKIFNPETKEERYVSIYELHHILTFRNESIHKISKKLQPSSIVLDYDLESPHLKHLLVDIMGTVAISQDEHKLVHFWQDSDIGYWIENGSKMPWIWQSEKNFSKFCSYFNIDIKFETFRHRHTLEWLRANHQQITLIDPKDVNDCKTFIDRFR